jgi:hypothetical protein
MRYRVRRNKRAQARADMFSKTGTSIGGSPQSATSWTSLWGQRGRNNAPIPAGPQPLLPELTEEETSVVPGRMEMPNDTNVQSLSPVSQFSSTVPVQLDGRISMISDASTRPGSLISQQLPQYMRYYNVRNSLQPSEQHEENGNHIVELEGAHSATVRPVYELPGDEP